MITPIELFRAWRLRRRSVDRLTRAAFDHANGHEFVRGASLLEAGRRIQQTPLRSFVHAMRQGWPAYLVPQAARTLFTPLHTRTAESQLPTARVVKR